MVHVGGSSLGGPTRADAGVIEDFATCLNLESTKELSSAGPPSLE